MAVGIGTIVNFHLLSQYRREKKSYTQFIPCGVKVIVSIQNNLEKLKALNHFTHRQGTMICYLITGFIPYTTKYFYFHCLGTLLILKSLYIGAVSMKSLRPSLDVDSYFHAGPISHDAATPPTKPPN